MCEQCSAQTVSYGEVLPGFALVRASRAGRFMEPGQWGLVEQNDPFFVFDQTPSPDPTAVMLGPQIDAAPDDHPMWAWLDTVDQFLEGFRLEPETAHRLLKVAEGEGFTRRLDGSFGHWLFHRMGKVIAANPDPPRKDPHA